MAPARHIGGSAASRAGQRLPIRPWDHGMLGDVAGPVDFGMCSANAIAGLAGNMLRRSDQRLKGEPGGFDAGRPVRRSVRAGGVNGGADVPARSIGRWAPLPAQSSAQSAAHRRGRRAMIVRGGMRRPPAATGPG
jgi:hypothetical protein